MGCIYKITTTKSDKIYIGSSLNFNKRKNTHLFWLKRNKHHSSHLQGHVNKHGIESISFEIVEECDYNLLEREQFYIDTLKPKFNICKFAGNTKGWKHTKKALAVMSAKSRAKVVTDNERLKKSIAAKGKIRTLSHSNNISNALKGKPKSELHKINTGLSSLGRIKTHKCLSDVSIKLSKYYIDQYDIEGIFIKRFETSYLAYKELGIPVKNIQKCCRGKYKTASGFVFKYVVK